MGPRTEVSWTAILLSTWRWLRTCATGALDRLHLGTPGYPLLLVAAGATDHPTRALLFASLLLHLGTVAALAATLRRVGGSVGWVLLLVAVLLLPPYVEPAAYVMTENLAQTLLAAGLAALVLGHRDGRCRWWALASLALSVVALVRAHLPVPAARHCRHTRPWSINRPAARI